MGGSRSFKVTSREYGKLETLPNDQMGMSGRWIRAKRGKSLLWLQLLSDDILLAWWSVKSFQSVSCHTNSQSDTGMGSEWLLIQVKIAKIM